MSSNQWSIQRTKRKSSTTTPTPRKRVRIADDTNQSKSSKPQSRKQQTLTQIQFIKSPQTSFEDDHDMREFSRTDTSGSATGSSVSRKRIKRDSTLTQMEWLGGSRSQQGTESTDLIPLVDQEDVAHSIPQLDGTNEVAVKRQRKGKSESTPSLTQIVSDTSIERETQEYRPTKRKRRGSDGVGGMPRDRRRSKRIATKVFSDPGESLVHASLGMVSRTDQGMEQLKHDENRTPKQSGLRPQTPPRRYEIPSSQTPETVKDIKQPVRQLYDHSPSKASSRTPLQERSTNTAMPPSSRKPKTTKALRISPQQSLKRSKICVLKLPCKQMLPRVEHIEDSQHDVYSLLATSSPTSKRKSLSPAKEGRARPKLADEEDETVEIPSTSPVESNINHSLPGGLEESSKIDSLPDLQDLFPTLQKQVMAKTESNLDVQPHVTAPGERTDVPVRYFARSASLNVEEKDANEATFEDERMLLDDETPTASSQKKQHSIIPTEDGYDSDFDSPVANDTQFNIGLLLRTSSPDVEHETEEIRNERHRDQAVRRPTSPRQRQNDDAGAASNNRTTLPECTTSIPTPRLVHHNASPSKNSVSVNESLPSVLPPSVRKTENLLSAHRYPQQMPLSDVVESLSSSSPVLPTIASRTPRGIHPASMLRPSQMSTQEPTQNFLPSSMPVFTQAHLEPENITIKDSSSVRLSQIPQYETQNEDLDVRLVEDSDDDTDDLDLDPPSAPLGRQSARKPTILFRKETSSSLRSLHPYSDKSDPLAENLTAVPSSSATQSKSSSTPTQRRVLPPVPQQRVQSAAHARTEVVEDSDATSSPISSPLGLHQLLKTYDPIPGFDNETQSNFTQNGHITAAYIHRQRETGIWPEWFLPQPFQVPKFTKTTKDKGKE